MCPGEIQYSCCNSVGVELAPNKLSRAAGGWVVHETLNHTEVAVLSWTRWSVYVQLVFRYADGGSRLLISI